jgi:phospholipase D1/2
VGRNCWRRAVAERAAFLVDGEAYFSAFADAVARAQHSILLTAWDVHSRTRLRPGRPPSDLPDHLGDLLNEVVSRRPRLHAYVLDWDFAMIYALEREKLPLYKLDWRTHRRLHFRLDGNHPPGASHHQKIAVIDDAVAFVGGFDLSSARWDTPQHLAVDPRRINPWGKSYPPHHDVQLALAGPVAAALGDLVRERWRRATGQRIAPPRTREPRGGMARLLRMGRDVAPADPWPPGLSPDFEHVEVGIARTEPHWEGRPEVREVEALHLDAIASARRHVFIENQYLTSTCVRDALVERLNEPNGPEVVLVLPCECTGWLEENTMGLLRHRLLQRLAEADRHGRLRAYYPVVPGLANGRFLNVHSKVLVIDDDFVKVGSSNASNRSMGVDTECDAAIEAGGDARVSRAIAGLRNRLLGEHLGVDPERIGEATSASGSLVRTIESLRHEGRTLVPVAPQISPLFDEILPDVPPFDPERPIRPEHLLREILPDDLPAPKRHPMWKALAILLALAGVAAAWRWTPLREWISPDRLTAWTEPLRDGPMGLLAAAGLWVLAALLLVPVTVLTAVAILAFGPLYGFGIALGGGLVSAAIAFSAGRVLWRDTVRRIAGRRLNRLSRRLARSGLLAVVAVRLLPIAPFTVVNLVCGASHVRFRDFFAGSALVIVPGTAAVAFFADRMGEAVAHPRPGPIAVALALVAAITWLARLLARAPEDRDARRRTRA